MSKKLKRKHKQYPDMSQAINEVRDEILETLDLRKKEKYFESITLLYSFIENLLKWLVFIKSTYLNTSKKSPVKDAKEWLEIERFCKKLSFRDAEKAALMLDLIDFDFYKRIGQVREERNDIIHQFWIYCHRGNTLVLRKKLEKLVNVSSQLTELFNRLTREIGVDEVYEMFLWDS